MSEAPGAELIDYLHQRGALADPAAGWRASRLPGGVSSETYLLESASGRVVVKRALGKLLVDRDWLAKPQRAMTEAAALTLLHRLSPDRTPGLIHADPGTNTLVLTAAPAAWVNWKEALLGSCADPTSGPEQVARELGELLGHWHRATWHDRQVAERFADYEAFEQLRVSPFHRAVAAVHPDVAGRIHGCAAELLTRRDCLVHGDFSPKNVLVGTSGFMVLDFEVAHVGAAVFDLAFLCCHLTLKALHLPARASELVCAARAFVAAYQRCVAGLAGAETIVPQLGWHTACLMLARVDGLSPATYLTPAAAARVRELGRRVLSADPSPAALWDTLDSLETAS